MVILFGDGVLCREPEILLGGKREVKAGACKALDGIVLVVGAHQNAGALEIKDRLMEYFLALCILKEEFGSSGARNAVFRALVNVAICMTRNGDGFNPAAYGGLQAGQRDGRTEYGAIQNRTDGAVGALIHLFEVVLGHALRIRGNRCALHTHAVFLHSLSRLHGDLVVGLIAGGEAQIVVFSLKVDIRGQKMIFNHLPDDAGHFVSVHLHEGGTHLNLAHCCSPLFTS